MAITDLIRGRQTATRTLQNKSGGGVVQGDVVYIGDGSNDNSFTTGTTASFNARPVGVAMETIANDAFGLVALSGYVPKVNSAAGLTRFHWLYTSTVAKEATGSASRTTGAFGIVLESATDPEAIIFDKPEPTAAGGLDLSGLTAERSIQGVSDYAAIYDASAADERGMPIGFAGLSRGHTVIRDECIINAITDTLAGGVLSFASGTGAAMALGTSATNHPGVVELRTGTTTTGRVTLGNQNTGSMIFLAGGKARFLVVAKLTTLSDGTETFTIRLGLNTSFTGDGTDGVYFRYTHSVLGGEWQGVARAASSESTLDTNVAADTNWHSFEFEVNAAGSSVEFLIDGTSVGTIASNIPTASVTLMPAQINKSAGSTSRIISVDAYQYILEFTTAR